MKHSYTVPKEKRVYGLFQIELMFGNSTKNEVHQISFCNWLRSKLMILTLFLSKKPFNHSVYFTMKGHWGASVEDVSFPRINNCSSSSRHGLNQVVNHLRWWPPTPAWVSETVHAHLQWVAFTLARSHLSRINSIFFFFFFKFGDMVGQGKILTLLLARNCVVLRAAWGLALSCWFTLPHNVWCTK